MRAGKENSEPIRPSGFLTSLEGDFLEGGCWVEWSAQGLYKDKELGPALETLMRHTYTGKRALQEAPTGMRPKC